MGHIECDNVKVFRSNLFKKCEREISNKLKLIVGFTKYESIKKIHLRLIHFMEGNVSKNLFENLNEK